MGVRECGQQPVESALVAPGQGDGQVERLRGGEGVDSRGGSAAHCRRQPGIDRDHRGLCGVAPGVPERRQPDRDEQQE